MFEDSKGVIRSRKLKKYRQHNGQKKKDRRTKNDLHNITQKIKDRATGTPLSYASEFRCFGMINSPWSTCCSWYKSCDKSSIFKKFNKSYCTLYSIYMYICIWKPASSWKMTQLSWFACILKKCTVTFIKLF
jgi:hypothetical protein